MNPEMYCSNCGTVAEPQKHTPGTFLTEAILWLFLIIPGLIYSIWRIMARKNVCPACQSPMLLPLDSPKVKEALSETKARKFRMNAKHSEQQPASKT